jgi:hypothetical protein
MDMATASAYQKVDMAQLFICYIFQDLLSQFAIV